MIQVDLPGITLRNQLSATDPYLVRLEGWYDSGERNHGNEQRPNGLGSFGDDSPEEPSRVYTVSGEFFSLGGDWLAVRRSLVALQNITDFRLTVTDYEGTLHAIVNVAGRVNFGVLDERGYIQFEVAFLAVDPRKYRGSEPLSTGPAAPGTGVASPVASPVDGGVPGEDGRIILVNDGSAPSAPILTVTGALSGGFELVAVEKGRRLRLERPVLEGSFIRIDMDRGQVWIDDLSPVSLKLREWWQVEPGETVTVQFNALGASIGTPTLTADFAAAER